MAGPRKMSPRSIATAERRSKAIELRRRGYTWQQISDDLGYASRAAAYVDLKRVFEQLVTHPAEGYRGEELDRLDGLMNAVYTQAIDPSNPKQLDALDRVLKIQHQRARYLQLYTLPPSTEISAADGRIIIQFSTPPPDATVDDVLDDVLELDDTTTADG